MRNGNGVTRDFRLYVDGKETRRRVQRVETVTIPANFKRFCADPEEREALRQALLAGEYISDLAKRFDVCFTTILYWRRQFGITIKPGSGQKPPQSED